MKEKKVQFLKWVKTHRKQLITVGISVAALVGIIIGIKNKDALISYWSSLEKSVDKQSFNKSLSKISAKIPVTSPDIQLTTRHYSIPQLPVEVKGHLRNLPKGRHHSQIKAAEALALGIELLPNQTIIDPYTKYMAA